MGDMESMVENINEESNNGGNLGRDGFNDDEDFDCDLEGNDLQSGQAIEINTPRGSTFWIPRVDPCVIPKVGLVYESIDKAIEGYTAYADIAGFEVRRGTQKTKTNDIVKLKYVLCSRSGYPRDVQVDTLNGKPDKKKRNRSFKKSGCKACIKFKLVPGTSSYRVYGFEDKHNHPLIRTEHMHLTRKRRQLLYCDRELIKICATQKLGASKTHTLLCGLKGGHEAVSGTKVDFKNHQRDYNNYIGEGDSKMWIKKMNNRKEHVPNFVFEYKCEDSEMVAAFWADDTAQCNYGAFGDIVSFDGTYRTNRHQMIFVPFTGIDNHKKCVTFGAGVVAHENTNLFEWLLRAFLKAHKKEPTLVVTDQCAAMKIAIDIVFQTARHRLCMWHIGNKLTSKVNYNVCHYTDFKARYNKLVWNNKLTPEEFESKWRSLIDEFDLQGNTWLAMMFDMREMWIPAYFRELPLSGLMRTTSRSESENYFFSQFAHFGATLLAFGDSFDAAMDKQRHDQSILDHKTATTSPTLKTPLAIERNASMVYTRDMFILVQKQIQDSIWSCSITNQHSEDGTEVSTITETTDIEVNDNEGDTNATPVPREFTNKVVLQKSDETIECTCLHFVLHGILCRHIFCVLRRHKFQRIPEKYILKRWTRDLIPTEMLMKRIWSGETNERRTKLVHEGRIAFDHCVSMLSNDDDKLEEYVKQLIQLKKEITASMPSQTTQNKDSVMESIVGISKPDVIDIHNPTGIRNKGCGTGKRLKSRVEKAISESTKPKRLCRRCGEKVRHDSRNCPLKNKVGE